MAISTIGTDGLASSAVTSAKLASGAPSRAQLPAGTVLQVVQTVKTDFWSTSSTSAVDITGLSVSITPTSATSKILILANVSYSNSQYTNGGFTSAYFLVTDGSNNALGLANADGLRQRVAMGGFSFYEAGDIIQKQFTYLWSPNTTTTQTVKIRTYASNAGMVQVNESYNENNVGTPGNYTAPSQITLMEIAA
jgi:hypothetical protein